MTASSPQPAPAKSFRRNTVLANKSCELVASPQEFATNDRTPSKEKVGRVLLSPGVYSIAGNWGRATQDTLKN